jgi:hypothetical protein
MPARKLETWRPSECPIHGQVHAIWLDGHYGRWSAFHERTRYTCVRFDEAGVRRTHRFVPPLAARLIPDTGPDLEEAAGELEPCVPPRDFAQASDDSTFTVPEIARLLIAVGEGKPLRGCAHHIRAEANRRHCAPRSGRARPRLSAEAGTLPAVPLSDLPARPVRPASLGVPGRSGVGSQPRDAYNYSAPKAIRRVDSSRSASTAMDYVDQYGPVILGSVAPDRWPAYVALGSVAVPRRPRRSVGAVGGAVAGHGGGGQILVAADCELPGRGFAFHARFAGANDKDSWIDFFRSLAGRPTWIVAERSEALSRAVAEHWPETIFFGCEEHLREGLRAAARADRLPERDRERGPIYDEIRAAFRDLARWEELVQAGEKLPPARSSNLRRWLEDNEALVLAQFFHKKQCRSAPVDDLAVRAALDEIREKLVPHAGLMRNLWRINLRLALMCAHWSGLDGEREYAAALSRHFTAQAKQAGVRRRTGRPDWSSGRDFHGASSIDDFVAAAEARSMAAQAVFAVRAITAPPQSAGLSRNAARVAVGLPPIPPRPDDEPGSIHVFTPEGANWLAPSDRIELATRQRVRPSARRIHRAATVGATSAPSAGPGRDGRRARRSSSVR